MTHAVLAIGSFFSLGEGKGIEGKGEGKRRGRIGGDGSYTEKVQKDRES